MTVRGWMLGYLGRLAARQRGGGGGDRAPDWVRVASCFDPVQAQIAASRLADEAIPSQLHQDSAHGGLAFTVGIFGRIDIWVPDPLSDRARTVLRDTMDGIELDEG